MDERSPRHFNHNPQPPKKKLEIDAEIDLPEIVTLKLALEALEKGLTLNELCVKIITEYLDNKDDCPHNTITSEEGKDIGHCDDCGKQIEIL